MSGRITFASRISGAKRRSTKLKLGGIKAIYEFCEKKRQKLVDLRIRKKRNFCSILFFRIVIAEKLFFCGF
jgi:hypothetical protein